METQIERCKETDKEKERKAEGNTHRDKQRRRVKEVSRKTERQICKETHR